MRSHRVLYTAILSAGSGDDGDIIDSLKLTESGLD